MLLVTGISTTSRYCLPISLLKEKFGASLVLVIYANFHTLIFYFRGSGCSYLHSNCRRVEDATVHCWLRSRPQSSRSVNQRFYNCPSGTWTWAKIFIHWHPPGDIWVAEEPHPIVSPSGWAWVSCWRLSQPWYNLPMLKLFRMPLESNQVVHSFPTD